LFHLPNFNKNQPVSGTNRLKIASRFSEKPVDLSAKPANLSVFPVSLFLRRLWCVSTKYSQISLIFTEFFKNQRDR
jgi:hypothetical protein